jgi:hypothetical protein
MHLFYACDFMHGVGVSRKCIYVSAACICDLLERTATRVEVNVYTIINRSIYSYRSVFSRPLRRALVWEATMFAAEFKGWVLGCH